MSDRVALWVVGEPGVGKTTLVRKLLEPDSYLVPKPKWTVGECICAAGHYNGGVFDGADTVPYNGVEQALTFWKQQLAGKWLTIFDGDRFSHARARELVAQADPGIKQYCMLLTLPEEEALSRRQARGTLQNPTWVKGRRSKAARFASSFGTYASMDARLGTDYLANQLMGQLRG